MNSNRVIKQKEALTAWGNNPRSTLNLATGFGKTYIALCAVEKVISFLSKKGQKDFKILIIVPSEIIRDEVFPNEFKKFGKTHLMKYCQIECIQTVYKYENTEWDLVICDEIHNYLPENGEIEYEYFKFFENNKYRYILGLSASIDTNRMEFLNKIAPITYKVTLEEAVKLGIISPFTIYNVEISLTTEEAAEYRRLLNVYSYYEKLLGGRFEAYSNSIKYLSGDDEDNKRNAIIFRATMKKRQSLLNDAYNKISCTQNILKYFPNTNGIIFSESILQCHKLVESHEKAVVYHSKLKKSERLLVLRKLNDKRTKIRYISAVRALNEGLSIDSIGFAIITAGNSKVKDMIQRIGRSCRFVEDKKAIVIRLYVKGTQEEKWVRKSQEEFDKSNINYINEEQLWKILKEMMNQ
jgi:superfamily II DNA or RNA helicase